MMWPDHTGNSLEAANLLYHRLVLESEPDEAVHAVSREIPKMKWVPIPAGPPPWYELSSQKKTGSPSS
jgi:hypothetical protein